MSELATSPRHRMARLLVPDAQELRTGHGFDAVSPGGDLVSVVVPSYQHEEFVEQALESVARQTHRNIEIVLIDDQSSDRTFERALKSLEAGALPYCALRRTRRSGMDTNVNAAILLAYGQWIAFLASDDAFPPGAFEVLSKCARRNAAEVAVGAVQEMSRDGELGFSRTALVDRYRRLAGDALRKALLEEHGSLMVQGMLISRSVFASVGMLATDLVASDFDLLIRMASRGVRFAFVDEVTALHRLTRKRPTREHIRRSLDSHLRIARQHARSRSEYRLSASTVLSEVAAENLHYGYYIGGALAAGRAALLQPLNTARYFLKRIWRR
jgi:glycosyltransferase involved in cell wall biosynthesis